MMIKTVVRIWQPCLDVYYVCAYTLFTAQGTSAAGSHGARYASVPIRRRKSPPVLSSVLFDTQAVISLVKKRRVNVP